MSECIFCSIVDSKIPAYPLSETARTLTILDAFPNAPGHALVLSKEHYPLMHDVPDNVLAEMVIEAKKIAGVLSKFEEAQGYNILINNGRVAGQVVDHCHIHVVPRREGDRILPQKTGTKPESSYFVETQKKIREALK